MLSCTDVLLVWSVASSGEVCNYIPNWGQYAGEPIKQIDAMMTLVTEPGFVLAEGNWIIHKCSEFQDQGCSDSS